MLTKPPWSTAASEQREVLKVEEKREAAGGAMMVAKIMMALLRHVCAHLPES